MDFETIGLVFAFETLVSIVAEIPTGYFADRWGRKTSVVCGVFLLAIGTTFILFAQSFWWLFVGATFGSIGRAFVSGSLEALVYDSLKAQKLDGSYDKVVALKTRLSVAGFSLGAVLGGKLYGLNFRLPYIIDCTVYWIAFISVLFLSEVRTVSKRLLSEWDLAFDGFKQLWSNKILYFISPLVSFYAIYFLYDWGLSKPALAVSFGLNEGSMGVVYSIFAILNFVLLGFFPKIRSAVGDFKGLTGIALLGGIVFIAFYLLTGFVGVLAMLVMEVISYYHDAWVSSFINSKIESDSRATTLSTLQFLGKVPFVMFHGVLGLSIKFGWVKEFHLIAGVLVIVIVLANLLYFTRHGYGKFRKTYITN